MLTLEDFVRNSSDKEQPRCWQGPDEFFIFQCGRWRQFGWCCGRLRFTYRYTRFLMSQVDDIIRRYDHVIPGSFK